MNKSKIFLAVLLIFPALSRANEVGNLFAECSYIYTLVKTSYDRAGDAKNSENLKQRILYSIRISGQLLGEQQRAVKMNEYINKWKAPDQNSAVYQDYQPAVIRQFRACEILIEKFNK